jgi:hypothetical protein
MLKNQKHHKSENKKDKKELNVFIHIRPDLSNNIKNCMAFHMKNKEFVFV